MTERHPSGSTDHVLWGGRFDGGMAPDMRALNLSLDVDRRLWREDVRGSRAWARALIGAGVISDDDGDPTTIESLEWRVNGALVATTPSLDSSFLVAGDDLQLAVAVSDGEAVTTGTTEEVRVQLAAP